MRSLFPMAVLSVLAIIGFLPCPALLPAQGPNAPGSKQLASVDGIAITEAQVRTEGAVDLDSLQLEMLRAKAVYARSEHQILERAMERLLEERLLGAEAAKRGISKEELMAKELPQNVEEPTSAEIDAFYEANKQRINRSKEEVASQITAYLKKQKQSDAKEAFLKKLEKEHTVTRALEPLRFDVNATERPSLGPSSAPVVLVLFSDFQCPYCKSFSATLKEILKHYGDKVRLVYRQFPLIDIHPNARQAAEASLCAAAQNRFWEMHDLLFQGQDALKDEDLRNKADKVGLDSSTFSACLASKQYGALIHEDMRAGAIAGVEGTPALFVNGRFLGGSRSYEEVASVIDEELKTPK